ncbi:hypothetical protein C7Y66_16265 [Chroococcidiopsis sp. CCALA 051]|nr:hypothetical protein C7Y66_16265 [Chroococcidiopsis sp. CCALA 051]
MFGKPSGYAVRKRVNLIDTPQNWSALEAKCWVMHNNALNGCFDPTLEKYSLNNKQKLALLKPPIREANLFDQILEKYKPKLATPVR